MSDTNDFSSVKVGDKLWSIQLGECEVMGANYNHVVVKRVSSTVDLCYELDGKHLKGDAHQSLFWFKPEIIAPPRPKRKVTKTLERWVNVYPGDLSGIRLHRSESDALCNALDGAIATVRVTGTYEVEE